MDKYHFNSLLRHWLDRFQCFGNYPCFKDTFITGYVSLKTAFYEKRVLSNDILVKFATVAIDSCCAIQERLNLERKPSCVQELITAIEQTLVSIGVAILHLIKRSVVGSGYGQESENGTNHRLARVLLVELLHRCPMVSAPCCGYASPVIISFFRGKYKQPAIVALTEQCMNNYHQLMKMIVESHSDLNAVDHHGNTILHIVMSNILYEISELESLTNTGFSMKQVEESIVESVRILLENGSYPNARNKEGKLPGEGLEDVKLDTFNPENINSCFKNLLAEFDCSRH